MAGRVEDEVDANGTGTELLDGILELMAGLYGVCDEVETVATGPALPGKMLASTTEFGKV